MNVNIFIIPKVTGTPIIAAATYARILGEVGNRSEYKNTSNVCIIKFGIYDIKYFTNRIKCNRSLNVRVLFNIYENTLAVTYPGKNARVLSGINIL